MEREIPWYKSAFGAMYLELYAHRDRTEAERQVQFIVEQTGALPVHRALDIGCGAGRHTFALASREIQTIGFDLSAELLKKAVLSSATESDGAHFVQGDTRALPFAPSSFGLLINMFTSFGYFASDDEHLAAIEEWKRVIAPGGTIVLDFANRDYVVNSLVPESTEQKNSRLVEQKRQLTLSGKRIEKQYRIRDLLSGAIEEGRESVRLFSPVELAALFEQAGLTITQIFGGFSEEPLSPKSERVLIFATRPLNS